MKVAELFLITGLAAISLGTALLPFPMFGMIGRGLLPVALVLFVAAYAMLPTTTGMRLVWRRIVFLLYLFAILLLIFIAGEAVLSTFDSSVNSGQTGLSEVTTGEWILPLLSSFLPAALFFLTLHLRSTWSDKRCLFWSLVFILVSPVSILIFQMLASVLPLRT